MPTLTQGGGFEPTRNTFVKQCQFVSSLQLVTKKKLRMIETTTLSKQLASQKHIQTRKVSNSP